MKRALSIATVLFVTLGLGLPGALGGDTAPVRPAGSLPWDRLAELQAPALPKPMPQPEAPAGTPEPAQGVHPAPQQDRQEQDAPATLRDPTEPGEEMRDMVAPFRMGQPGRPSAAGLAVPRVTLKGRVIGPSSPPAAMVELQGALYLLQVDSELTVDSPEAAFGGLTLRVTDITASEVRIEVMPLRTVIVLR